MAVQWYCQINEEQVGPISSADLKRLCKEHKLLPNHLVRQGEEGKWIKAAKVQGLFNPAPAPAAAVPVAVPVVAAAHPGVKAAPPAPAPPPPPPTTPGGSVPLQIVPRSAPLAPAAGAPHGEHPASKLPRKNRDNTTVFVAVGLAICLGVLAAFGAFLGLAVFGPGESKKEVAAATPSASDALNKPTAAAPAKAVANEASAAGPKRDEDDGNSPPSAQGKLAAGALTPVQKTIIRGIGKWYEKHVRLANLEIQVTSAWIDVPADPPVTTADILAEARAAPKPPPAPEEEKPPPPPKPRFVFIEVNVKNVSGPGVLPYKSWNGAGKRPQDVEALLVDSEGNVCRLIAREQTPADKRQETAEVAHGESVTDTLVFEAPPEDFEHVRLVLPHAALGRVGHMGFHIPRDRVAKNKAAAQAAYKAAKAAEADGRSGLRDELQDSINLTRPAGAPEVEKRVP